MLIDRSRRAAVRGVEGKLKKLILLAVLCSTCSWAQQHKLWKWSVVAVAATTAADCHSSYGAREMNPLLRGAGNRFDAGSVALKAGVVGALILGQKLFLLGRKGNPKRWAALNFSIAATTGGFAARNYYVR